MGCVSCSTGGCSPSGCGSKGHCASGGCNRLNVYDWLSINDIGELSNEFDIVEVQFKGSRKGFFKNSNNLELYKGDFVAVEAQSGGFDVGKVILKGELVRLQLKRKRIKETTEHLKIYRIAQQTDLDKLEEARNREPEVLYRTREIVRSIGLDLKLGDIEFQGDKTKATFYYTADGRVDFRELVKQLATEFKVRIEMRQIGARQESARIGGIGSCGRELCCSTWLTDFKSVNTSAARYQNLSLNPLKLAGQCGRLKCCLNYELDTYIDALKGFPKNADLLKTKNGTAEQIKTDIFKRQIWYQYKGSGNQTLFALQLEQVNKILEMNSKGIFPDKIEDFAVVFSDAPVTDSVGEVVEVVEMEFEEGNLNRFDTDKRSKNKQNNRNRPNQPNRNPNQPNRPDNLQTNRNPNQAPRTESQPNRPDNLQTNRNPNQASNRNPNQTPRTENQPNRPDNLQNNRNPNQANNRNPNQTPRTENQPNRPDNPNQTNRNNNQPNNRNQARRNENTPPKSEQPPHPAESQPRNNRPPDPRQKPE